MIVYQGRLVVVDTVAALAVFSLPDLESRAERPTEPDIFWQGRVITGIPAVLHGLRQVTLK